MNFQQQIIQSLLWRGLYFVSVLVMNIVVSRYFEAGNAGWIFYLSNNLSLLLIIVGLTMEASVNYYASKGTISIYRLTWFSICWSLLVTVVLSAGLWTFFNLSTEIAPSLRAPYFYYSVCYIIGIQLTSLFTVLFYSRRNFFLPNLVMILLNVGFIMIIPWHPASSEAEALLMAQVYFGYFLVTGLAVAISFIAKYRSWRFPALPKSAQGKLLIRYALMALSANLIFFLVYRIDYWFVKQYCSDNALGNYIQVSRLAQMLLIVPTIISSVVFPHTARGEERTDIKNKILRIGRVNTILFLVLFVVVLIFGRWLFPWLFGATFNQMYLPFLLIIPGIWALSNLYILSSYFGGINKVNVNIIGSAVALVVIIICDVVFIPLYGMNAAAVVSTIGYLVNFLYSFFMMRREHPITLKEYWAINKADIKWLRSFIPR